MFYSRIVLWVSLLGFVWIGGQIGCFNNAAPISEVVTSTNTTSTSTHVSKKSDDTSSSAALEILSPPLASVPEGTYSAPQSVELTHTNPQAQLWYSLNGSTPAKNNGLLYTHPIEIHAHTELKVIAVQDGFRDSTILTLVYDFEVPEPELNIPSGKYANTQQLELTTSFAGAAILYTTDGTTPSADHGSTYTSALILDQNQTVQAIAIKEGCTSSSVVSATYAIGSLIDTITPGSCSLGVALNSSITVAFSEPLNTSVIGIVEIHDPSITLEDGVTCDMTITSEELLIDPYTDFAVSTQYTGISISGFQTTTLLPIEAYEDPSYYFITPVGQKAITDEGSPVQCTNPMLAFNGTGYGIIWEDDRDQPPDRDIYFVQVDGTGTPIASEIRLSTGSGDACYPTLVWTGNEYGIAWQDKRSGTHYAIYFARINATGELIANSETLIASIPSEDALAPSIAWNNTHNQYGLCYHKSVGSDYAIQFIRMDPTGEPIAGSEQTIFDNLNETKGGIYPHIIWNADNEEYAVVLRAAEGASRPYIYFYRMDYEGAEFSGEPPTRLTSFPCSTSAGLFAPMIRWSGTEYGVGYSVKMTWASCSMPPYYHKVFFKRVGDNSTPLPDTNAYGIPVSNLGSNHVNESAPVLVWNGESYGAFFEAPDGSHTGIYYQELNTEGTRIPSSTNTLLLDEAYACKQPYALWNGAAYALVWADERTDGTQSMIYFGLWDTDGLSY